MSYRLGSLKPRELVRKLKQAGFDIDHTTGSHVVLFNSATKTRLVVPYHVKELKRGLLFSIVKQSGLTLQEFQNL